MEVNFTGTITDTGSGFNYLSIYLKNTKTTDTIHLYTGEWDLKKGGQFSILKEFKWKAGTYDQSLQQFMMSQ